MDILQLAAQQYKELLHKKYIFVLGKNKKLYNLEVVFSNIDFYHLAGLHKLADIPEIRTNASIVFKKILNGTLTIDKIQKSKRYYEIEDRLLSVAKLEYFMDSVNDVFKYDVNKAKGSRIVADFLLRGSIDDKNKLYFMISFKNKYVGVSFFSESNKDYTQNQMKLTLLRKEKVNCHTSESTILYKSPNYNV